MQDQLATGNYDVEQNQLNTFSYAKPSFLTNVSEYAIFIPGMITERGIQKQKDVYVCFIHYSKAFYKLRHKELLAHFGKLDLFDLIITRIQNIWE